MGNRVRRSPARDGAVIGAAVGVLLALVVAEGADLRRFSAALGVAVFGLLVWRVTSTWPLLSCMERALGVLLTLSPLVGAVATASLVSAADTLPSNPWLWLVVAHRFVCVALVAVWPRWLCRSSLACRECPEG